MSQSPAPPRPAMQDFEKVLDQSATDVAAFEESHRSLLQTVQHFLHGNPAIVPVIVLVASVLIFGGIANNFLTSFNLSLIIGQVTIIGILGIAQTLIILTAGIDLSVAAIMMLCSVIMGGLAVSAGVPAIIAIPIGLVVGGLCGLFNGALVAKIKLPPFIVTLGSWSIFFALVLWLSGGEGIRQPGHRRPGAAAQGLRRTRRPARRAVHHRLDLHGDPVRHLLVRPQQHALGELYVYAVGDDAASAQLAGIRVDKVLISVYATAGVLCGLAGWAAIGRVGSVSPQSFYEGNLDAITAVVIGGTSLFGGRGSILGTLVGALIVGVFRSGLNLAGVDVLWQQFAVGALIIVAVAMDQWLKEGLGLMKATREPILMARNLVKRYGPGHRHRPCRLRPLSRRGAGGDRRQRRRQVEPDQGAVRRDHAGRRRDSARRQPVHFTGPMDARDAGIETVYQTLALSPALSISDNLFLGREIYKGRAFSGHASGCSTGGRCCHGAPAPERASA